MKRKIQLYIPVEIHETVRRRLARCLQAGEKTKQNDIYIELLQAGLKALKNTPAWRDIIQPKK